MTVPEFLLALGIGFLLAGVIGYALQRLWLAYVRERQEPRSLKSRIKQLTDALLESTSVVDDIAREIASRQALIDKLEQDAETYSRIANLKRPEVEAVAQLLSAQLKSQERRALWQEVLVNFVFFVLGVVITILLSA